MNVSLIVLLLFGSPVETGACVAALQNHSALYDALCGATAVTATSAESVRAARTQPPTDGTPGLGAGSGSEVEGRLASMLDLNDRLARRTTAGFLHAPQGAPDLWFAEDKLKHYFMSLATTNLAYGGFRTLGIDGMPGLAAAAGVSAAAGLWKEFWDRSEGRPFSRKDLVWDGLGIATALVVLAGTR